MEGWQSGNAPDLKSEMTSEPGHVGSIPTPSAKHINTVNRYPLIRWALQGFEDEAMKRPPTPVPEPTINSPVVIKILPEVPEAYKHHLTSNYSSKRTILLYIAQNGACYWCGIGCFLRGDPGFFSTRKNGITLSGRAATLDHIYSKLHPYRYRKIKGPRFVMACNTCNGKRSKEECSAVSRKEPMIYEVA